MFHIRSLKHLEINGDVGSFRIIFPPNIKPSQAIELRVDNVLVIRFQDVVKPNRASSLKQRGIGQTILINNDFEAFYP